MSPDVGMVLQATSLQHELNDSRERSARGPDLARVYLDIAQRLLAPTFLLHVVLQGIFVQPLQQSCIQPLGSELFTEGEFLKMFVLAGYDVFVVNGK